jgi:hypothetical protein
MSDRLHWARLLAFVTGLVNQELLLRNEYLAAENRILRAHLPTTPKETTKGKVTSSSSRRKRLASKSPEAEYAAANTSAGC